MFFVRLRFNQMPITKSAKKALRQSSRRKVQNDRRREAIRRLKVKFRKALEAGKTKEAEALLPELYKAFDKASKTGVIKKNTAARKKSRLVKAFRKAAAKTK